MKCPKCNGYGKVGEYKYYRTCQTCGGTGEVPQTNEEWFCSLSTEEKAKRITCLDVNAEHKVKQGLADNAVEVIVEWLKTPHKENE